MPKSNSSPPSSSHLKSPSDEGDAAPRLSDVALRKKKNADAQAAFRARRANYIATLEETVTSLESVVLQLQESCRDGRAEISELRHENVRLRSEMRDRDKFWRGLWHAKRTGQGPDSLPDELPPLPSTYSVPFPSSNPVTAHMNNSAHMGQYSDENISYPNEDPSASLSGGSYHTYGDHSGGLIYATAEGDGASNDSRIAHLESHKMSKYGHYPSYGVARNGAWPQAVSQTSSSGGESCPQDSGSSSHSPAFVESPTLTSSGLSYAARFPVVEDQKVPLSSLDAAPYVFSGSPTHSPTTSTPPLSSSVTPFQYVSDGTTAQERTDYDYRRQTMSHAAEVTLHGGTADISLGAPHNNGVRYRLGSRRANSGPDRPLVAPTPQLANHHHDIHRGRGSSEGEGDPYHHARHNGTLSRASRSPSPGTPPISGTLAVIKAQAFGALRRTRTRSKKTTETAAKVAMVLEARGIGMGLSAGTGSKRPRLQSDDEDN
ncbi:hypothetical protein NEOLEDRAFT_1152935 [Neolentinus lepideus HHB14362 ss-1]|uniref:BZIP domain-containing protein n=1 Tax=Neolentinus lepideus HHB14362 ss-1 TaxID=1314782 RepID=A0A165VYN2_9AGAM|nr:hypothetical protein NEOLEDRAFT_1152935 [Neolentinus lepideus HHB14362 ss-1]